MHNTTILLVVSAATAGLASPLAVRSEVATTIPASATSTTSTTSTTKVVYDPIGLDAEYMAEVTRLVKRKRKGVVCTIL
ncbi:hypothetical protein EJ02DRAFT_454067 [Clathrospora elynae]|uniref:Uncharacterized protein n=1 Tax=Clathrospora elynae TaxID=706981 RepID=A0A6A5T0V5_9PLEO|nr:hypothetical protein EJ02DRAFT_454067 [Clathrospora elynae]